MIFFLHKQEPKPYFHANIYLCITLNLCSCCSPNSFGHAQSTESSKDNLTWSVNPIYTVISLSILTFLLLLSYALFYFCFRHYSLLWQVGLGWPVRSRASSGLDASVLKTFPVLACSEALDRKPDIGALECAVCLSPFEADEALRLLPKCDHVFHMVCVDAWLATQTTCPLCRANLVPLPLGELSQADPAGVDASEGGNGHVVGAVVVEVRREIYWRCNSTGHVAVVVGVEEDAEKLNTGLADGVRDEIVTSKLNRSRSSCTINIEVE